METTPRPPDDSVQPGGISLSSSPSKGLRRRRRRREDARPPAEEPQGEKAASPPRRKRSQGRRPRRREWRWRVIAALVAVCAFAALLFTAVQSVTLDSVVNFLMFGTTDPYISPARQRELQGEFKEMIQKELGGPGKR